MKHPCVYIPASGKHGMLSIGPRRTLPPAPSAIPAPPRHSREGGNP